MAAVLSLLTGMVLDVGELCVFCLYVALVPPAGVAVDLGHLERQYAVEGYAVVVGKIRSATLRSASAAPDPLTSTTTGRSMCRSGQPSSTG